MPRPAKRRFWRAMPPPREPPGPDDSPCLRRPEADVGAAARVDLGRHGLRTGKAAEPAPVALPAVAPQGAQVGPWARPRRGVAREGRGGAPAGPGRGGGGRPGQPAKAARRQSPDAHAPRVADIAMSP